MIHEKHEPYFPNLATQRKENKVLQLVFNADLRGGHDRLAKDASKLGIEVDRIKVGDFVVFVNRKRSALKIYAAGFTIAHFRMPDGRVMDPRILRLVPKFFNGKELNYSGALEEVIKKEFKLGQ